MEVKWFRCNVCGEELYDGSSAICHQDSCDRPIDLDDWVVGLIADIPVCPTKDPSFLKELEVVIRSHVNMLRGRWGGG